MTSTAIPTQGQHGMHARTSPLSTLLSHFSVVYLLYCTTMMMMKGSALALLLATAGISSSSAFVPAKLASSRGKLLC